MKKIQAKNETVQGDAVHMCGPTLPCSLQLTANSSRTRAGFTLIEMMISVAIFTVVMIYGIGSLLSSNQSYRQTQNLRKAIDNLSFTIEDMARSLRVGTNYQCASMFATPLADNAFPTVFADPSADVAGAGFGEGVACPEGVGAIFFESAEGDPATDSDQYGFMMLYNDDNVGKLYKTTDGGVSWLVITPPSVNLDPIRSGFMVTGTGTTLESEFIQPLVFMHLVGTVQYGDIVTPFNLQTSVSQRALDQ
jgi:prepilin-type N-terminal cleavage/methylation domain-containing protein